EVGLPADRLVGLDPRLASRPLHREAVVLGSDLNPPGSKVLDRGVGAAVTEWQLEGLQAHRPTEQLVAETDAEEWLYSDQLADGLDDVIERAGIAGPVGEEDDVGVLGEDLLGGGVAGQQGEPAIALAQLTHDTQLHPGVDPDHVGALAGEAG